VKLLVRLAERSGRLGELSRGADDWLGAAVGRATEALGKAPRLSSRR
jgi:hypothetical protein